MERSTALTFLSAALLSIGSACAHAQAPRSKIPFDFTGACPWKIIAMGSCRSDRAMDNRFGL